MTQVNREQGEYFATDSGSIVEHLHQYVAIFSHRFHLPVEINKVHCRTRLFFPSDR